MKIGEFLMNKLQRFNAILACTLEIKGKLLNKNITRDAALLSIYAAVKAEQQAKPTPSIYMVDLEKARQAIYFFVDENFLDTEICLQSDLKWYNHSLQRKFFDTDRGGELFYEYFEQILDVLCNNMPISDNPQQYKKTQSQPILENTSLDSLNKKFCYVLQSINCLNIETLDSEFLSKLAVLNIYAQCLLFGFRGKYYSSEYDDMLKELRTCAHNFFYVPQKNIIDIPSLENQYVARTPTKSNQHVQSYFFYICCPLIFCILWYFYCAGAVVRHTVSNI